MGTSRVHRTHRLLRPMSPTDDANVTDGIMMPDRFSAQIADRGVRALAKLLDSKSVISMLELQVGGTA